MFVLYGTEEKRVKNMNYKRFNISESNLEKGMIVSRKGKTNKAIWRLYRNRKRNKWTFIY